MPHLIYETKPVSLRAGIRSVLLALWLPVILLASGCLSTNFQKAGLICEELKPKEVYIGKDGSLAVKATSSFYRFTFLKNLRNDTMKSFGTHYDNSGTTVSLRRAEADRFVIIPAKWIESKFFATELKSGTAYPLKYICYFNSAALHNDGISFIPKKYLGPAVTVADLPEEFPSQAAAHSLDQPVEVIVSGQAILLDLNGLEIDSSRSRTRWWVAPVALPLGVVDLAVEISGGVTGIILGILTFPFS